MDLHSLLATSRASEAFKNDVLAFAAGAAAERVQLRRYNPPIKVIRLLAQLLHAEPSLAVERVTVDAWSGCSDFTGMLVVESAEGSHHYEFSWDCRWRAEQEGWTDCFGFPDQIRAAREFDWRCFGRWSVRGAGPLPVT